VLILIVEGMRRVTYCRSTTFYLLVKIVLFLSISLVTLLLIQKRCEVFNHPHLATSYKNIDLVNTDMDEYSKVLSSHEKALASSHSDLATTYNDMGLVYYQMDNYRKLFSFYERAVDIGQR
jgi:tetratricopeptide (TPR) repeat protein